MSEKSHSNNFRFVLYQGKEVVNERSFTADEFNPVVRYSVDIRESIPSIIQRLQKILSRRNLNFKDYGYDYLSYYQQVSTNDLGTYGSALRKPKVFKQTFNNRQIKGVEFKFGLYINNNPIVERKFYVDNYNPASRFSTELTEVVNDICEEIYTFLKNNDVNHMWDDYTLINTYGLFINQIRELHPERRKKLLANIGNRDFIKKTKSFYRNQEG